MYSFKLFVCIFGLCLFEEIQMDKTGQIFSVHFLFIFISTSVLGLGKAARKYDVLLSSEKNPQDQLKPSSHRNPSWLLYLLTYVRFLWNMCHSLFINSLFINSANIISFEVMINILKELKVESVYGSVGRCEME